MMEYDYSYFHVLAHFKARNKPGFDATPEFGKALREDSRAPADDVLMSSTPLFEKIKKKYC
jgi:hypothetical protein